MTTEQTYSPPAWSMMAPSTTYPATHPASSPAGPPPARLGGRPEEIEEQRRFAAAFAQAQAEAAPEPAPQHTAPPLTQLASSPEERMSNGTAAPPPDAADDGFFGEDGFTLGDFVDIINPLQHLPVISTVYRELTGDEISPGARLAGGTLYGGPIGLASAVANNISEEMTGKDVGGAVMAALTGEDPTPAPDASNLAALEAEQTAEQMAALSPAAGPTSGPTSGPATGPDAEEVVPDSVAATQASPIMAAQPPAGERVAPFAAIPNGSPLAVIQPPGVPLVQAPPQGPPNVAVAPETSTEPVSPPTAVAQGVPTLSPDVANVLLRMSQQSQTPPPAQNPVVSAEPPPAAPETVIAPPPPVTPPQVTPPQAPPQAPLAAETAETAEPTETERPQVAGYIDPVSAEDLPSAMMDALLKYESMKQ